MSGICAAWRKDNSGTVASTLASLASGMMLDTREEVDRQSAGAAGVGLSARFSTQQIFANPQILIACDAELHNEGELNNLAPTREKAPEAARTAALLARLYERFGPGFAEKLRGGFSFVLWDVGERRLVAATDGFGIKRLVYYSDATVFLIASRIEALLRTGHVDPEVNPKAIAAILNFTANLAPETIFQRVQRLCPGTVLVASEGHLRHTKYWDMRYDLGGDQNEARLSRELEGVVQESVAAHCKNDAFRDLGAYLSGGTDSSTVVGMMDRLGRGRPKAFSIGFQEQSFNELHYAQVAARKFQAEHYTYLVGPEDCCEALPQMVRYFDEPYGNSSAIPTYFCARLAAQNGVKALLAGDGGDELFGGNERYATDKIFETYHYLPRVLRKGILEPFLRVLPIQGGLVKKARGYVRRANMPPIERFLSFQFLRTHSLADVFDGDFVAALGDYSIADIPARHYEEAAARHHLDKLLYVDMKITLADNDLPKVTCMSELAGVQTRFPFLDRSVAEFSGRVPARLKVKGFKKRYLFKQAFRELLPPEIIHKQKHGFGIPVATWMKSHKRMRELTRDTLSSGRMFERGYFRRSFVEGLFAKHETDTTTFYGDTLWTLLALELWHRQIVDQPAGVTA